MDHTQHITSIQFEANRLVSASYDKTVKVWDIRATKCIHTMEGHEDQITCLRFERERLATGR